MLFIIPETDKNYTKKYLKQNKNTWNTKTNKITLKHKEKQNNTETQRKTHASGGKGWQSLSPLHK